MIRFGLWLKDDEIAAESRNQLWFSALATSHNQVIRVPQVSRCSRP